MKNINTLLTKMNASTSEVITLKELAPLSLHEIRALSEEKLSWHEAKILYTHAQEATKINKLNEAHHLARNNPQVQNAVALGVQQQSAQSRALGDWLPNRDNHYVDSKSVASMFSPAGYLTELYREAKEIHAEDSMYHLDKRRPDLAQLVLSQENMDKEVSTLSLSNQILTTALQSKLGSSKDLFKKLATTRLMGENPYHQPYETIRQTLLLRDDLVDKLVKAKDHLDILDTEWISTISSSISPELYAILTEVISDDNVDELVEKNFGNKDISLRNNLKSLSEYYSIPEEEISLLFNTLKENNELSSKDLLILNKIIRLHKATGISFDNLIILIRTKNNDNNIDSEVIRSILHIQYIMEKYNVNVEQSIVLNGANINQHTLNNSLSLFDILFNSPPIGENKFIADNKELDFNSSSPDDIMRINTLKRAFHVDDIGIVAMWKLAFGKPTEFTCSIENISLLYRVYLLATVHDLDIYSLSLLLDMLPEPFNKPINKQSLSNDSGNLIYTIDNYCKFIKEYKLSISELYLMTAKKYDLSYTNEMKNIVEELMEVKFSDDDAFSERKVIASYLPILSYYLHFSSSTVVYSVWEFVEFNNLLNLSILDFKKLINKDNKTLDDKNNLVTYIQMLCQMISIFTKLGLNENEINILGSQCLLGSEITLPNIESIKDLSEFHHFYLDKINNKNDLNNVFVGHEKTSILSMIYCVSKEVVEQIFSLLKLGDNIKFDNIKAISSYIDMVKMFNITPNNFNLLTQLKLSTNESKEKDYLNWDKISKILQSGLNAQQVILLKDKMDEKESVVFSAFYIHQFSELNLLTSDDIYNYLLIDNKVSSEIKTTKIEQAIASIQLYINEFLSLNAKNINTPVASRQFFRDWDKYNKRYSTWSGISLLAYYPENYIDPTVRIGQTKMMDTLLQTISQNSINSDTIDDAFKTYLTSFEQIANLDVISGYHDGVTLKEGYTYFVGCNASEKANYYWRSADHSKIKKGVMAANAWTEWTKIENGANPYNNLIRPVIFNNRLYLAWIEQKEIENKESENKDKSTSTAISKQTSYSLNLSHIRYDGTWSTSVNFQLSDNFIENIKGNFHLSYNQELDKLYFLTYITSDSYKDENKEYQVYSINNEMVFSNISDSNKEHAKNIYINVKSEFDIAGEELTKNINNSFVLRGELAYSISHDPIDDIKTIDSQNVSLSGSLINGVNVESKNETLSCYLSAFINCNIDYGHLAPEPIQDIFKGLLKDGSILEDIVYTSGSVGKLLTLSFSGKTDYSYYLGFDIKKNTVYFFIYDNAKGTLIKGSDINNGGDYNVELSFFTKQSNGLLKYTSKNNVAFTLSNELGNFSLQSFLNKETPRFLFYISGEATSQLLMGAYGKQISYPLTINKLNKVSYSDKEMVNDIKITLSSSPDHKVTYSLKQWSNANTSLIEGSNSFNSKNKELKLDVPQSEFNDNGEFILTVNVTAVNKSKKVISESQCCFKVSELEHINESIISLKTNKKHAQYISMTVENEPLLVRLNTLFARQLVKRANNGIDAILTLSSQRLPEPALEKGADVPMDFNGANALYFWELFYYTPMMLANVMLEGQNYDEASRWLRYVFNPNGYIDSDTHSHRVWNSQPLLADTAWDNEQLDSTDPDAVAQTDPMHYKLSTFMKCLDIFVARGDSAYRLLERDTLNDAKMWYMQALKLLGDETELLGNNVWSAPKLTEAASKTKQPTYAINEETVSPRTANSLTSLFLPQINEKLAQYHDTLKARLFNLRHNLSIDGQPLSLPMYATPVDPKMLQNTAVSQSQENGVLPKAMIPVQRFPAILTSAKSAVNQLMQFGNSFFSITERQDAQALAELLVTQGSEIILQNIKYQQKTLEEFEYSKKALQDLRSGAKKRLDYYSKLYNQNISTAEQQAMDLYLSSSVLNTASQGLNMAAAAADLIPNIYGMAVGGSRLGAIFNATSIGLQLSGSATRIAADRLSQSEAYRRRREEWGSLRDSAQSELDQFDAQLAALAVRQQAMSLQLDSVKLQQQQTQEHLTFLQNKFTNKALYNWLRGKLMAIYKPFYDLTVSRCRMAESAYQYDLGEPQTFIRPGAWQGNYSGLMAGESLMHNLIQMENSYLEKDKRALEITKIVSLNDVYQGLSSDKFSFEQVADVINKSKMQLGTAENGIRLKNKQLQATVKLYDLAICKDYPDDLGQLRRIKQISVTLPALTGAYQNIRAVLSYGGSAVKPRGCNAIAISHGMNDSGQFQLNFNDDRYLPFEGLPVDDDTSTLTLSFPDATDKQKEMLLTLSDIILHINYTIR
ncbi:neuraminidase-like domain-containing protein [Proteus columbae]|uniref:Tc toxin subunit A-related protein n=1 Tax=Proteus columbae TaxID=1987580 RepID=UPI00288BE13F|nr:neuraminidase-like domain-containing protein [Proteus columbae]